MMRFMYYLILFIQNNKILFNNLFAITLLIPYFSKTIRLINNNSNYDF